MEVAGSSVKHVRFDWYFLEQEEKCKAEREVSACFLDCSENWPCGSVPVPCLTFPLFLLSNFFTLHRSSWRWRRITRKLVRVLALKFCASVHNCLVFLTFSLSCSCEQTECREMFCRLTDCSNKMLPLIGWRWQSFAWTQCPSQWWQIKPTLTVFMPWQDGTLINCATTTKKSTSWWNCALFMLRKKDCNLPTWWHWQILHKILPDAMAATVMGLRVTGHQWQPSSAGQNIGQNSGWAFLCLNFLQCAANILVALSDSWQHRSYSANGCVARKLFEIVHGHYSFHGEGNKGCKTSNIG